MTKTNETEQTKNKTKRSKHKQINKNNSQNSQNRPTLGRDESYTLAGKQTDEGKKLNVKYPHRPPKPNIPQITANMPAKRKNLMLNARLKTDRQREELKL